MNRLSDRGSIPLRSIFKKTLEILDFRGFLLSGGEKKCRFEPFHRFRVEKLGSKSKLKSFEKSMVLECFGVLQIKKMII